VIAAAGPLTDLVWATGCALALRRFGADVGILGEIALGLGAVLGAGSAVGNGSARVSNTPGEERDGTDGAEALRAIRMHGARAAAERRIGQPLTRAETYALERGGGLAIDAIPDARASVAPPTG
jgi:hypothetical protein